MGTLAVPVDSPGRISALRLAGLGTFWLGTSFVITPVYTLLLQSQVQREVLGRNLGGAIGLATGLGGILAMLVPPLAGHFSDRLHTPWGRRRPVIFAGAVGTAVALAGMAFARTYPQTLLAFVCIVALLNMAGAAYVALIPDTVHSEATGRASGIWGSFFLLGSALSAVLVAYLAHSRHIMVGYSVLALVLLGALVLLLVSLRGDQSVRRGERRRGRPLDIADFIAPLWKGDFGWAFMTRLLIVGGTWVILPFLVFTFRNLEHVRRPLEFTATFEAVMLGTAVPVALVCGMVSDRLGRKRFVYASGLLACCAVVPVAALPPLAGWALLSLGAVLGASLGCFTAVDWALALDTLPDRDNPAKDLGLFHVADALPRVFAPFIGGQVLDVFNSVAPATGYRLLFAGAMALFLLGTFFVSRIRSVA